MHSVVVNARIHYRGRNGTAVVVEEIVRALGIEENVSVAKVQGPRPVKGGGPGGRALRLMQSIWWDGWASGRVVKADTAIFPTAVGGWWSKAETNVLIVHDLMVLNKELGFDWTFRLSSAVTWPISISFADVIVTPSEWTRREVIERWPRASHKVVVIPWASRLPVRTGEPKRWNPADRATVVVLSATEPHKDHLQAMAVVQTARVISGVDFALAIIGPRGRAEGVVAERAKIYDPTQAWISRHVDMEDDRLSEILDSGFALLNTSKAEGFGLPLLEAAARDLPVVHSRTGAMNEVINLDCAETVTTLSLAYELTALLEPAKYQSAVERGRAAVRSHSPEQFANALVRVTTQGRPQ